MPHPGLSPDVISFNADAPVEYKNGFRNPKGLFPAAISSSFNSAITLAKMGEAHEVPSTNTPSSWKAISISTP